MGQSIHSKLVKKDFKAVYCHPAYLAYVQREYIMWNAGLDESQDVIKIAGRKISNHRYADWYHSNGRKKRRAKQPLDEGERG